jgi:hypothetical protein
MPFIFKISVKTNNMLVYNKISNYEEEIFDCCTDTPDNDTPGSDCCSDAWVKDLAKVSGEYKTVSALVSQKQVEYDLATDWKIKLRAWCDDWEATDEKADALCRQLELFIKHLHRVCKITEKTVHAVKILFCMAEDLYKRTDELKAEYDKLVQCINCLKRPELAPGKGIMKCIEEYGKKLDAVIATRDIVISNIVKVLELTISMHINICDEYGLKGVLKYWKQKFNCDGDCPDEGGEKGKGEGSHECCELEPHVSFPIDQDKYYVSIEQQYADKKNEVEDLKKDLDKLKHKRDGLLSLKQSLEKAIDEVKNKCN